MKPLNSLLSILYTLLSILTITSCHNPKSTSDNDAQSIQTRYAQLLRMDQHEGYITAEIKNPWDTTKVLHRYYLVEKDQTIPDGVEKGDIVHIPLSHSLVATSVHASLINEMGAYAAISGVCDKDYIFLPQIKADIKAGKIADCGNSMTPDIEHIIDLSPDAIFLSPFETSGTYGKVGKLNIPIIEVADYMESSPLGRAEWMRFYGILFGRQAQADSIFSSVEKQYNELKASAAKTTSRPTVFTEMKTGATWYVAGATSTVGQLLTDAGAAYIFSDLNNAGSQPFDPEVVFDRCQQADYWLLKYGQATPMTYPQLSSDWPNNSRFKAFQEHKVYACNLQQTQFYEDTPFHPELLLRDFILIFHPELLKGQQAKYYQPLQ